MRTAKSGAQSRRELSMTLRKYPDNDYNTPVIINGITYYKHTSRFSKKSDSKTASATNSDRNNQQSSNDSSNSDTDNHDSCNSNTINEQSSGFDTNNHHQTNSETNNEKPSASDINNHASSNSETNKQPPSNCDANDHQASYSEGLNCIASRNSFTRGSVGNDNNKKMDCNNETFEHIFFIKLKSKSNYKQF